MGPSASSETPRRSATHAAVTRTHSGSLRERGAPGGDRNGESVSTSRRSVGHERSDLGRGLLAAPEDEAREADREAEVDDRPSVVERPGVRVDDRRRAVPERRGPARVPHPGRAQLVEQRVLGVAPPLGRAAVEDRRLAGLEREREVAPQVGQLVRDRAEDAVVVEPGLADRHDPRVARPGRRSAAQPASSTLAASCGWTPTAASSHGNRSTSASARSDEATFQPGTRIRSTPARRAPPMTRSASRSNRSALRWQWLSIRQRTASTFGRVGFDVEPREERLRRSPTRPDSPAWAPQASSSRIGGPPLPSGPYG